MEEFVTDDTHKAVWVIHIPKHAPRQPVIAHGKAWQRVGDSLVPMTEARRRAILDEMDGFTDWSAVVIDGATLADLDAQAIARSRAEYSKRNPSRAADMELWDDITFLNKAKLTIKGGITRTALLLLGSEESEHLLAPAEWVIC